MVAVIREWRDNLLSPMLKNRELQTTARRAFMPRAFLDIWTAPQHLYVEFDETGQWADDGGRA